MSDLRVYRQARFQLSLGVITLWFVIGVRPSVSVPLLGGSGGGDGGAFWHDLFECATCMTCCRVVWVFRCQLPLPELRL